MSGGIIFSNCIVLLLVLAISIFSESNTNYFVRFSDSSVIFNQKRFPGLSTRSLSKELKRVSFSNKIKRFEQILDSLGYFNRTRDTLIDKSIAFFPGNRAIIGYEIVNIADSLFLGLTSSLKYPVFYNASELEMRSRDLILALANNGYPFASVAIELEDLSQDGKILNDTFVVKFNIHTDEYCLNARPAVHGLVHTDKRLIFNDIVIHQNAKFDRRKLLITQQRLESRKYISKVDISQPQIIHESNTNSSLSVITPIYVTDKSGIGFDGAAGFSKVMEEKLEISGNFSFSLLNIFHAGESSKMGYSGDSRQQLLDISISKPWIFNLPIEVSLDGGLEVVKQKYGFIHSAVKILNEISTSWKIGIELKANEITSAVDTVGKSGHFYGASFIISEIIGEFSRGQIGQFLHIDAGSGFSNKDKKYARTQLCFEGGIHVPFYLNQAIASNIYTYHMASDEKLLLPAEMFRIGGNNSLRGYIDNEYAFRTVVNGQIEYLLYFNELGALYIFTDGAIGNKGRIGYDNNYIKLLGYGFGVKVPSRFGTMTIEWARNIQDTRNLGRVHIRYRNGLF